MTMLLCFFIFLIAIFCDMVNFCNGNPVFALNTTAVKSNAFPFVVSIGTKRKCGSKKVEQSHMCGGALITRKHILTAAHCYIKSEMKLKDFEVKVGSNDLRKSKKYTIKSWITYAKWAKDNKVVKKYSYNDISIIELSKKVSSKIQLARFSGIPSADLVGSSTVRTAGWGLMSNYTIPRYMLEVKLNLINRTECTSNIVSASPAAKDYVLAENQFCTNGIPYAVLMCGWSGSPVLAGDDEIIGIDCSVCPVVGTITNAEQNIHIEVVYYMDFIKNMTGRTFI